MQNLVLNFLIEPQDTFPGQKFKGKIILLTKRVHKNVPQIVLQIQFDVLLWVDYKPKDNQGLSDWPTQKRENTWPQFSTGTHK